MYHLIGIHIHIYTYSYIHIHISVLINRSMNKRVPPLRSVTENHHVALTEPPPHEFITIARGIISFDSQIKGCTI